ncbi:AmmeMemoRadiSam system radical SAM enzyme [Spirochaetia bacterium]|nr:AmmeMemoRadiSam system radical SAM enzyme [Spirochaetia bacterium]
MRGQFFSGSLHCDLCPRRCDIPEGKSGRCGVRQNLGGEPLLPRYGFITAMAMDPIEKKPLYHFRPGSSVLSIGFSGCNLHCPFCQNWRISQNSEAPGRVMDTAEIINTVLSSGNLQIAYTYSEPLIHIEFLLDCMKKAREAGIANVLVTNGCINTEAAEKIVPLTDAANIDLKCFSEKTYADILGGNLQTVLDFIRLAHKTKVHVEITTLVVPGLNDSQAELDGCADFIAGLGPPDIPWHLTAYHPDYRWNAPPTDPAALREHARRARQKVKFVYTGNI